jgi:hypothetical protein
VGLTLSAGELRRRFRSRVDPLLNALEMAVGEGPQSMRRWDASRCRGEGYPAEEAVERARGDKNRSLFVE